MNCLFFNRVKLTLFISYCILFLSCLVFTSCENWGSKNSPAVYKQYRGVLAHADSLYNEGRKEASLHYVDSLLRLRKEIPAYGKYICYAHKAHYYNEVDEKKVAKIYADSALTTLERYGMDKEYPEDHTHALLDIANIMSDMQDYEGALDYYTKAKLAAVDDSNSCSMSAYNYHIAMTLHKQWKLRESIHYFNESFAAAQACDHAPWYRMQEILANIALTYSKLENRDSTIIYLDSAISFLDLHDSKFENKDMGASARALVYGQLGFAVWVGGNPDSAIRLFKKSIEVTPPSANVGTKHSALAMLIAIYRDQKDYPRMYATLQEFDRALIAGKNIRGRNDWQRNMTEYYMATGQYEKAVDMKTAYHALKDSMAQAAASLRTSDVEKDVKDKEQQYQISLLKKDNELKKLYLWITVSCSALFAVIIVLVFYNYRRSRRKSAQIRKQNEELEQLNREKDKILGVVAHDLRNPIGVISYLSDIMIEDGEERSKKEEESLGMILSASQHSMALINELLELKTGKPATALNEKIDLVALAKECEAILQFRLKGKDQQMVIETDDEQVTVQGNSERLSRLIQNLLTNAIKFSYPGSTVLLKLQRKSESILLSVADTGIGIPADMQPDLLNTFTGARRKGTADEQSFGLGLSISKQIVDEQEGKIWFESEEGKGTTFFVELPLVVK